MHTSEYSSNSHINIPSMRVILFLLLAGISVFSCKNKALINNDTLLLSSAENIQWKMIRNAELKDDFSNVSNPDYKTNNWQPAIIPGTVLNSLVANGVFPEPYYGLNNKITNDSIPDISEVGRDFYHFVFRTEFEIPDSYGGKEIWIKLNGINYIADIWLNGKNLGKMKGMFKGEHFNISEIANIGGKNALLVDVQPVEHPGKPMARIDKNNVVQKENKNGGDGEIGKNVTMLMTAGWDFTFSDGIRDRNTGIWLPVEVYASENLRLSNPFVKTDLHLPDTSISYQTVRCDVSNSDDTEKTAEVIIEIPEKHIRISKTIQISANETKEVVFTDNDYEQLVFDNPRLWWPFGKGGQNLYTLNISVSENGLVSDRISSHFGIREITSDRNTPDSSRLFYVNGEKFFVAGGNYIPEGMLRKSKKRTKAELLYTKQAGINFLRFWGGGISEDEYFFNLCDSLGILLWHEFWMTGDTKPPVDLETYYANVRYTVKRIRKHPSLAYYVSSNEQDDVIHIKPILDELDGTRGYQYQSECCGVHDGSPYKYENPMQYYDNTASDRGSRIDGFCPEYGTVCTPPIECLQEMMKEEDIFPVNKQVWDYLDGNAFHNMSTKYLDAIRRYGEPSSVEEFALKGQLVGAMAYRGVWENWNYNKLGAGDRWTSGVLFWYHNSPGRQVCGRMWTWSLEPTAALYVTQKALGPQHIQFDYLKNTVTVLNNERKNLDEVVASYTVYNLNSEVIITDSRSFSLKSEEVMNDIFTIDFPEDISDAHFIALEITQNGKTVADNFYWRSNKPYEGPWTTTGPAYDGFESLFSMPVAKTDMLKKIISDSKMSVTVNNPTDKISFFNRVKVLDKSGNLVRPVFYSDNYFSIYPIQAKQ